MWQTPAPLRRKSSVGRSIDGRSAARRRDRRHAIIGGLLFGALTLAAFIVITPLHPVRADESEAEFVGPYPGTVSWQTDYAFHELVGRLQKSVTNNGMTLIATSSAVQRGGGIPENAVLLVFRNDYAVRMVQANVLAGMETPIRLYVTANADKKATITYRTPTSIFALYDNPKLDDLAAELDQVFAKIIDDAISS
jgi:uncharacterized protein (DUF302 family)